MAHVRVRKILVFLTMFALVLVSADVADAKKKRKKKKNEVPSTLVVESARGTHIAGTVESSRSGCVNERKVTVSHNGDPVGSADADSEGQWFIEGQQAIRSGDNIIARIEKVTVKSKNKKIVCGSDSDRFVVGDASQRDDDNQGATRTETLIVNVTGPGMVNSNPPGIQNCRQTTGDCQNDYPVGSTVNLTATPDEGATFTGWSGACSGTAQPCTVRMNGDQTVGASFAGGGGQPAPCSVPDTVPEPLRGVLCAVLELLGA